MATLDPSIILAGQQPNYLAQLVTGQQAGQARTDAIRGNQFNAMLQQQGPGILAGDQNALNQLAQFDPGAALGVQQTQQTMRFDREAMEAARKAAADATAKAIKDEQSASAAAAELEQLKPLYLQGAAIYQSGDMAALDQFLQSSGLAQMGVTTDAFPMFAAQVKGVSEGIELAAKMKPQKTEEIAPSDRYRVVGNTIVDLAAPGGPAPAFEAPGQTETIYGPDGQPIVTRGPSKPLTEGQSKDNVFVTRAKGALAAFEPVSGALTSLGEQAAQGVPMVGRYMQSDEFQVAMQAGQEFLAAVLRKDTGAAITPQEMAQYGTIYLPQPGDGAEVLKAKKEARARAIDAIQTGMSLAQIEATDRAIVEGAKRVDAGGGIPSAPSGPVVIDGFTIESIN